MSGSRLGQARERVGALLVREREAPTVSDDLYRRSVKASRGLALAEALLLLVAGFTLDDMGLLRFPGYAAGGLTALVVLAGGRLVHGRNLARRIAVHAPDDVDRSLEAARFRNAVAAVGAVLVFLAWLVFFSAGVPPWTL